MPLVGERTHRCSAVEFVGDGPPETPGRPHRQRPQFEHRNVAGGRRQAGERLSRLETPRLVHARQIPYSPSSGYF